MAVKLGEHHPFISAEARERYMQRYDAGAREWPVPCEERTVETGHGKTFVRISGPVDGPPLVLLGGVWANSLMWAPMIGAFAERYRTYAVDNICDFGRSVCSAPIKSTVGFMSWLDELFDKLDLLSGINLMGCSRGGWLTAEYALHAPRRLAKAVWHSPGAVVLIDYKRGMTDGYVSMMAAMRPSLHTVGRLMRGLMPDFAREQPDAFDDYVDETVLALTSFDRRVAGGLMGPRRFSDSELSGINVPVLYIAGEHETMYSPAAAVARLNAVAPSIETAVIKGAGHDLGTIKTEEFTTRVLQFLDA